MFAFSLLIGLYSYLLFALGILGWLYVPVVVWGTVGFALLSLQVIRSSSRKVINLLKHKLEDVKTFDLMTFFGLLVALQVGVNLIGVLGPERGFDALWYHLTLPKLYLQNHSIDFVPGGLLYYSAMPKLGEMLYTAGLAFGNENLVKFIHFSFGLLTCVAIYKLSRKFFRPLIALIAVVIFYSNLVVGWESTSAYVDLIRAFFEVMALWAFVEWTQKSPQPPLRKGGGPKGAHLLDRGGKVRQDGRFILSAIMVGLAITTKVLAVGSLVIFVMLIFLGAKVQKRRSALLHSFAFALIALVVPLPWFIFSYVYTGNPVYPFFTDLYKVTPEPLSLVEFVKDVWVLSTQASDPLSWVYVVVLPVGVWVMWRAGGLEGLRRMRGIRIIGVYCLLAIIIWYFTPRTGGGRFMLPYLPALSILCAAVLHQVWNGKYVRTFLLLVIIATSLFSIGYRLGANSKYVPFILGKETKAELLSNYLNFSYGDFYDVDGYFAKHIKPTDRVLLYGFHNLYYVDFPFVDASWVKANDRFNYVAVQNGKLPEEYKDWKLVYENKKTMVKLYKR